MCFAHESAVWTGLGDERLSLLTQYIGQQKK